MKRKFYSGVAIIVSISLMGFASEFLFNLIDIHLNWIEPLVILLTTFFWIEYFNRKYNNKGLWQIVSHSNRDKLSLVLHLVICIFVTIWAERIDVPRIYKVLIWLALVFITGFSFFIISTQEIKPAIKRYFSDQE